MHKIAKIKEIKSEVKIREIKKKEEKGVNSKEVFFDSAPSDAKISSAPENSSRGVAPVLEDFSRSVEKREEERIQEIRLYESRGKALIKIDGGTESAGKVYATAESIQTDRIREARVGRDFAMGQQRSLLPEDQISRTETRIRDDLDEEKKYEDGVSGGGGKGKRKYPWEI